MGYIRRYRWRDCPVILSVARKSVTKFDRRRVLTSLAGGAAAASIVPAISKEALADSESDALRERAERHYCWVLARQGGRPGTPHAVEFCSGPWTNIGYENYLPPQIARVLIAHEDFYPDRHQRKSSRSVQRNCKVLWS